MPDVISAQCPYCGESVDVYVDAGGGTSQRYIEDCPVCCRPWQVEIARGFEDELTLSLQTLDE